MSEKDDLVVIFAGSVFDATLVRNLLEGAQIEAFLLDEQMARLIPFYLSAMSAGAVKVAVRPADAEEARIVLSATDEPMPGEAGTWDCPGCGEAIEAQFGACWNCQSPRPGDNPSTSV